MSSLQTAHFCLPQVIKNVTLLSLSFGFCQSGEKDILSPKWHQAPALSY